MKYFIEKEGQQLGPFSLSTLESMLKDGSITEESSVWQEGWAEWKPYRMVRPKRQNISVKPKLSLVDRFLAFNFRFGKVFAALMAAIFLFGFVISLVVVIWNSRTSIKIPTFQDLRQAEKEASSNSDDTSNLDSRRSVETKYGDKLAALVKAYSLSDDSYDTFIHNVMDVPKKFRGDYVSGLENALRDAKQATDRNPSDSLDAATTANQFQTAFTVAVSDSESEKEASSWRRWIALGTAGGCCMATFLMLTIPAVLKIEENTRRDADAV